MLSLFLIRRNIIDMGRLPGRILDYVVYSLTSFLERKPLSRMGSPITTILINMINIAG